MNLTRNSLLFVALLITTCFQGCVNQQNKEAEADAKKIDREYVLNSKMTGYTGVGGDINGIRNHVLRAKTGERVTITPINGELMDDELCMEEMDLRREHAEENEQN